MNLYLRFLFHSCFRNRSRCLNDTLSDIEFSVLVQITVKINGIPSACNGNCGFEWSTDRTPTVTGITPTEGLNIFSGNSPYHCAIQIIMVKLNLIVFY